MLYLVDTGILLRGVDRRCPENGEIMAAFRAVRKAGDQLAIATQTVREFWNVSTRPASARGGYGRTVEQTLRWVRSFEQFFRILPETVATFERWRVLVERHGVMGVQVHDTNLVAVAETYGVTKIVTLNRSDFARYPAIQSVLPADVTKSPPRRR